MHRAKSLAETLGMVIGRKRAFVLEMGLTSPAQESLLGFSAGAGHTRQDPAPAPEVLVMQGNATYAVHSSTYKGLAGSYPNR